MTNDAATNEIQAVIFDLDGVIVDSEQWWDEVRHGLAIEQGLQWPDDATRRMQGMSTEEWSTYLNETVGIAGRPHEIAQLVIEAMAARYASSLPLIKGATEAVTEIASRWPVGIASSSPRVLIDTVLRSSGLGEVVSASLSTEQVSAGKPSPAVYLAVADLLGVEPSHTVGVEDSSNGLRSASAAGLIVVAVPNPAYPPAADAIELADAILADICLLTPSVVLGLSQN